MVQLQTEIEDVTNEARSAEERAKKAMTDVRMLLCYYFHFEFSRLPVALLLGVNVNTLVTCWKRNQSVGLLGKASCQRRIRATGNMSC